MVYYSATGKEEENAWSKKSNLERWGKGISLMGEWTWIADVAAAPGEIGFNVEGTYHLCDGQAAKITVKPPSQLNHPHS